MASIRKLKKKWLAEVRVRGSYKSKTFDSKTEAVSWAIEMEHRLGAKGVLHGKTVKDAFERYRDEVSPSKKGARWEEVRLNKLLRDEIANICLTDLTTDDIQEWINRQTISGSSINRELTLISSVLAISRKRWKWMDKNIMADVDRPKSSPARERRISEDEINKILRALDYMEELPIMTIRQEIAVAFLFSLETAMRQSEVWKMDWSDVSIKEKYAKLNETKNGTSRNVPLSKRAIELINKLPDKSGRVFKTKQNSAATIFRRALDMCQIKDLHWHDTRHEAITRLAKKLKVLDLAKSVGHKDIRSLQIYYNPTATELADLLD